MTNRASAADTTTTTPSRSTAAIGISRRIVVRYRRAARGGGFERASVSLEEVRGAEEGAIIRFDDAHGRFHRHVPGWPQPSHDIAEYFEDLPKNQRTAFATSQIRVRYTLWEAEVFGQEGGQLE